MTIGDKIKYLRMSLNYTQDELAAAINTTKQTIHKYENGIISNIPASKIKLIAEKLKTTPAYLMGWDENSEFDFKKNNLDKISEKEKRMLQKFRELDPGDQKYIEGLIDRFHESKDAVVVTEEKGKAE